MVNGWKITAIVFIILFILEAAFIFWGYSLAVESVEAEEECINLLYNIEGGDTYYFDTYDYYCEIYDKEDRILVSKYINS